MATTTHLKLVLSLSTLAGAIIGGFGWQYATQAAFGSPGDASMIMGIFSGVIVGVSVGLIAGGLIDVVLWGRLENIEEDEKQSTTRLIQQQVNLRTVTYDAETTPVQKARKAS